MIIFRSFRSSAGVGSPSPLTKCALSAAPLRAVLLCCVLTTCSACGAAFLFCFVAWQGTGSAAAQVSHRISKHLLAIANYSNDVQSVTAAAGSSIAGKARINDRATPRRGDATIAREPAPAAIALPERSELPTTHCTVLLRSAILHDSLSSH
eukprot:6183586-Pleurochrysis_carterae.AAC.5